MSVLPQQKAAVKDLISWQVSMQVDCLCAVHCMVNNQWFAQEADASDEQRLQEEENRRQQLAQLQAQSDIADTDYALLQEREEQISKLEVH